MAENEEELDEIDICKKYRQDQEYSMGESEKQLLNILDEIGVKRQAYHGNVFIGNHCKVILAKDKNQVYNFETKQKYKIFFLCFYIKFI